LSYHRAYYANNKEDLKARQRACYQAHKAYYAAINRAYYVDHREDAIATQRTYYKENRDAILDQKRAYYGTNKADFLRRNAARRAVEKRATPPWADYKAMAVVYAECANRTAATGVVHHVHHTVPLRDDPTVCGLHCESNLQVVTEQEHWDLHRSVNLSQPKMQHL